MKKIISILVVVAMMATLLVSAAFAEETKPQIVVESTTAAVGDEVTLEVSIVNNPGISNGKLSVTFDETALELVEVLFYEETEDDVVDFILGKLNGMNNGADINFVGARNQKKDGTLFKVVFKVLDNAAGDLAVSVNVAYIDGDQEQGIAFDVVPGKIAVPAADPEPTTPPTEPTTPPTEPTTPPTEPTTPPTEPEQPEQCKHDLVHVEAVEPGCHMEGNVEHWYCTICDLVCTDEAMTQVTNHKSVILPATGGELVHIEAVEAGCHMNGVIEHWYCTEWERVWADEALTKITNHLSVIVPAVGGEVVHVEAKEPTCYENGNIEHWYCEKCELVWEDEALTKISNHMNVIRGALNHQNLIHMEGVEAGCHMNGLQEHWYCEDCDTVWADEALTQITNHKNVIIPAVGGDVVHVEAKAPTCTENGNVEHWYCEKCELVWEDEALTLITNHMNVIRGATGHNYVDGVCADCGEVDKDVPPTGDVVTIVCALVAVSGMGLVALKKKED